MTEEEADLFDTCEEQIQGMYHEIGVLSKKKPDGPVNKFKLKFINELLMKANQLLGAKYLPLDEFTEFDTDQLPTASDVVFILSQYLRSMDKFRYDNTKRESGRTYWKLDNRDAWKATRRSRLSLQVD